MASEGGGGRPWSEAPRSGDSGGGPLGDGPEIGGSAAGRPAGAAPTGGGPEQGWESAGRPAGGAPPAAPGAARPDAEPVWEVVEPGQPDDRPQGQGFAGGPFGSGRGLGGGLFGPRSMAGGRVQVYGCSPGCLVISILASIFLTLILNGFLGLLT